MTGSESLRTPAWLLVGLFGNRPGVLALADGWLTFITEDGRVFDAPLVEVTGVTFPWYYFGGGVKLTVAGTRYRLSFVRPNGAEDIPGQVLARLGNPLGLLTAGRKIVDIGSCRQAGKAWKTALAARTASAPTSSVSSATRRDT
jgi:hypothetical protein